MAISEKLLCFQVAEAWRFKRENIRLWEDGFVLYKMSYELCYDMLYSRVGLDVVVWQGNGLLLRSFYTTTHD